MFLEFRAVSKPRREKPSQMTWIDIGLNFFLTFNLKQMKLKIKIQVNKGQK